MNELTGAQLKQIANEFAVSLDRRTEIPLLFGLKQPQKTCSIAGGAPYLVM